MSVQKNNGPIIDPALCRCCRAIKKCRILSAEYTWMGKKEIYADMVMDCYGILLSHVDDNEKDSGVCATCVVRLREAIAFRQQVLQCEELFLHAKLEGPLGLGSGADEIDENKLKKLELELKTEPKDYNSDHNSLDDRDDCAVCSDEDADDNKPLKKEEPKPAEPLPLKDEELKSEDSLDFNGESSSDSDEPIKKKVKRKAKGKEKERNGTKKKLGKGAKKQKAGTSVAKKAPKAIKKPPVEKKNTYDRDLDCMSEENLLTVIEYSYVCPFKNRRNNYYCFYCKDYYAKPEDLRAHTVSHDTKPFQLLMGYKKMPKIDITRIDCRLCTTKIDDLETFKQHIDQIHGKKIYFEAPDKMLLYRLTWNDLVCVMCSNVFEDFNALNTHMVEHFSNFTCDVCGMCFLEKPRLDAHLKRHKDDERHTCEVCVLNAMATDPAPVVKSKGPIVDFALCRCCRSIKKCRLMSTEYEWSGNKEVYADMLVDCFGLILSHLDGDPKENCICATCVGRLREASAFRRQVLQCEEVLLNAKLENKDVAELWLDVEVKVKAEPSPEATSDASMGDRDDHSYKPKCNVDEQPKRATEKRRKTRLRSKRELFEKALELQDKLDRMLDKAARSPLKKKPKPKPKKDATQDDHDHMTYSNTLTIVLNSYVCPFHNRISNYYCYYCRDQFTNPTELRDHTLNHDPSKLFESMTEYKKVPKIDITRIDCRLCSEKIDNLPDFKRHISTEHGKRIYPVENEFLKFKLTLTNMKCTECNCVFPYFDSLKKHMIEHFGTFICDQCGACFLEQNSLRTHIKSHNKVEANFPCEICGKNLKSKYSRYLHVATVHEKKPTVNCYKCDASFLSYALRNRHLIEVHGDKRTFPCKLCDKVYNRRKTLMEHNRRNHLKVYKHQCDLCDQRFYLPSRLKEHMATHTGERNYRCEFCDKCYPRLQSLQEHVRSHSSDRRFKCDACQASFVHSGGLKSHMKSHHQNFEMHANF